MKLIEKIILAVGLCMLGFLLWRMDAVAVWSLITKIGWGFTLILAQEMIAHTFNSLAWNYAYRREDARKFGFAQFFLLRIAGDGVNYLTPSGTIAGEFARAHLLDNSQPAQMRLGGVVVAKCAQALAQALFILFGLALFVRGKISWLSPYESLLRFSSLLVAGGLLAVLLFDLIGRRGVEEELRLLPEDAGRFKAMFVQLRGYLSTHPGRCVFSLFFFMLGYAWGAFEAYWACFFLGFPISAGSALAIEVLSNLIDGLCFMVPAKMGTQEAGKVAIFSLLGFPARIGFAFGVVRHIRELAWASLGMVLYSARLKGARLPAPPGIPEIVQP